MRILYCKFWALLWCPVLLVSSGLRGGEFTLVKDGQSEVSIVLSAEASPQLREAAEVLQDFFERSTGVRLEVHEDQGRESGKSVIYIGTVPAGSRVPYDLSELDDDGFVMGGVDPHTFVIIGGSDWGTEFGVYDFLEKFMGVRWLMPGENGLVIPEHHTVKIPLEWIRDEPVYYLSRTLSGGLTTGGEGLEWVRFHRIRYDRLARAHNLNRLFPVSQYGKSHPELYPILSGRRYIPASDAHHDWQPDFSNPESVKIAVQRIVEFFKENPRVSSYSLATNDTANFDESPRSQSRRSGERNILNFVDASDDYFSWASEVVEGVLKVYPDKWFGAQAYRETLEPPQQMETIPARLVPHITYERMRWTDPALREFDQNLTREWAEVAPTLGWYDYTYGLSYQVPRVWFHLMQEYLEWGADHNVRSYHADYLPNWSGEGPKTWLMQKLLWNPRQDVEVLLDDWYRNAVGEQAAPLLKEYYALWEKFWTEDILDSSWNRGEGEDTGLYLPFANPGYLLDVPLEYVERSDQLLDEVWELAGTTGEKERAERLRNMWYFYRNSVLAYQAEVAVWSSETVSEQQVLEWLNRAESILDLAEDRKRRVMSFTPEDGHFWHFYARPLLTGATWGNGLIWKARPWIENSALIRSRVESLQESENPRVKKLADMVLHAVDGGAEPLLENGSFEEGLSGWRPVVHRTSAGEFSDFVRAAADGEFGVLASSIQRGYLLQSMPYEPGNYYLRVQVGAPEEYVKGKVAVRFQVGGRHWRQRSYERLAMELPGQEIPLYPGSWNTVEIPFSLPPDSVASSLAILIDVTEFSEGGQVFIDDVQVYRIGKE